MEYTFEITADEYAESPREQDNLWTLHFGGRGGAEIKDVGADSELQAAMRDRDGYLFARVYGYDHGGIGLSLDGSRYPFNCPWDSFQGVAVVSKAKVREAFCVKRVTAKAIDLALMELHGEIETYSLYLAGGARCYQITDETGEIVDGCCGFYSNEDAKHEAEIATKALSQDQTGGEAMEIGEVYQAVESDYRGPATVTIADYITPVHGGGECCRRAIWRLTDREYPVLHSGKAYDSDLAGDPIKVLSDAEIDALWAEYWTKGGQ